MMSITQEAAAASISASALWRNWKKTKSRWKCTNDTDRNSAVVWLEGV